MTVFKPGDVIIKCKSFIHAVKLEKKGKYCDCCLNKSNVKASYQQCAGCESMYYCSKQCQVDDWKNVHKYECKYLKKLTEEKSILLDDEMVEVLFFRYCIKTYYDEELKGKVFQLYNGGHRKLDDLSDHVEDSKEKSPELFAYMKILANRIKELGIKMNIAVILKLIGQVRINAANIYDEFSPSRPQIAHGLFIEASNINHSCKPNAVAILNGPFMEIRATRDIDTNVEEVTLCYIDNMTSKELRKSELNEIFYFECRCELCVTETSWEVEHRLIANYERWMNKAYMRKQSVESATIGSDKIKEIIRKNFGDYHMTLLHLYRNQLDLICQLNQQTTKPGPQSSRLPQEGYKELLQKRCNELLDKFKGQASVIYGLDHPYIKQLVTQFETIV